MESTPSGTTLSPWRFDQWRFEKSAPVLRYSTTRKAPCTRYSTKQRLLHHGASKRRLFTMALGPKNNNAFGFHHGTRSMDPSTSSNSTKQRLLSPWRFETTTSAFFHHGTSIRWHVVKHTMAHAVPYFTKARGSRRSVLLARQRNSAGNWQGRTYEAHALCVEEQSTLPVRNQTYDGTSRAIFYQQEVLVRTAVLSTRSQYLERSNRHAAPRKAVVTRAL